MLVVLADRRPSAPDPALNSPSSHARVSRAIRVLLLSARAAHFAAASPDVSTRIYTRPRFRPPRLVAVTNQSWVKGAVRENALPSAAGGGCAGKPSPRRFFEGDEGGRRTSSHSSTAPRPCFVPCGAQSAPRKGCPWGPRAAAAKPPSWARVQAGMAEVNSAARQQQRARQAPQLPRGRRVVLVRLDARHRGRAASRRLRGRLREAAVLQPASHRSAAPMTPRFLASASRHS